MPELGPQFHVTTPENARGIRASGFRLGGTGGYGRSVTNAGPGIYTSGEHSSERWASDMVSYNRGVSLERVPVEHDPSARVHVFRDYQDLPGGRYRQVSVEQHLESHPDARRHFKAAPGEDEVTSLARATRRAGYDALHVDRGNTDETVWFDPGRLHPR